mgnify:CR=1 FL=1
MKKKRHELILRLITENAVTTQDELLELLKKNGYNVTQATVSRDIKELKLIKTPVKNGRSKYSVGSSGSDDDSAKFYSIFSQSVISVAAAIKCFSGTANAAAAAVDAMKLEKVVATLEGDDTIFVLCHSDSEAREFTLQIKAMLNGD